ncbi:unnamed protein product, partial [Closterium sp. NIES-54]
MPQLQLKQLLTSSSSASSPSTASPLHSSQTETPNSRVTPVTFRLRLLDTWKLHNAFSVQLLKPYKNPNQQFQGRQLPPPPPVLVQDEPEYEVECVLTHRRRGGKTLKFLLRWKGYDPTEDSWVVEADMGNARRALKDYLILTKEVLKNFTVEKFNGEGYDDWAWKMQLYFRLIGLLKLMIGEEPRPSDPALQEDWDERASAGYNLMSQSLEWNQHHHVMHLLPEVDCGPKAWTVLKELHAPTSVVATLMLERELTALRLSEGEPVQPVLDKMRDLYAKLATAGITYPEQTKCLKMLSLLPESWLQFTSGLSLPQNQSLWTLEWVRTKILEEDFRRRQLRGGDDGSSGYGMQGSRRGRGRGFGGAGRGTKKDDNSNDQQGGTGWGRGAKSGRGGKSEKKKERTAGQFFHIGEQGEQGDAFAKVGAELHPLDYWVLDTGTAWTMTPRKELLDDVRAAPINEVCSASGHALKVAGAGRAAFKGADGKPVVLHDVLLVPDLKANLISLRKLARAGVSTSKDGACTYKGQLGNRVLWDLHESKDVYRSMWQLPALAWH